MFAKQTKPRRVTFETLPDRQERFYVLKIILPCLVLIDMTEKWYSVDK